MDDKIQSYLKGTHKNPKENWMWTLSGTGFDHFGENDRPVKKELPSYGPDELLIRHDAVGLCAADVKLIRLGQQHPRITQDLHKDPVVPGHEVTLTVIGVGENLKTRYQPGDRFIVQPDIYKNGKGYGYGFTLQGGLSQYSVIDHRVLDGDAGCYLLPIKKATGYAESAIIEALAAVVAAYRLNFRSTLKPGGITWIIGSPGAPLRDYTISAGFNETSHPARLFLTDVPPAFATWLRNRSARLGVQVEDVKNVQSLPVKTVDDIVLLGADPDLIEKTTRCLAYTGVLNVLDTRPLSRKVNLDMGSVHYDRWVFSGTTGTDIADAYTKPATRASLKPNGKAWFVGSGGPIGRTHVQRALQIKDGPKAILATDLQQDRLEAMSQSYSDEATAKGVDLLCLSREHPEYERLLLQFSPEGFDDILVCAPSAAAIAEAFPRLAPGGVINIFAGVARNTQVEVDLSSVYLHGARVIGFSGSTVDDMLVTLKMIEAGEFSPNRLVMAIGSIQAAKDGLQAVMNSAFPGKIVIYNHIKDLPLTPITGLKEILPGVYKKLKNGVEWTLEAERELLQLMLLED